MAFAEILNEEARAIAATGRGRSCSSTSPRSTSTSTRCATGAWPRSSAPPPGCPARPPCTSATATASRPTTSGRRPSASQWRQYEQTFPLLAQLVHRPGVARMRQLPRADRAHRPPGGQGRPGRRHRRGQRHGWKPPRTWPPRSGRPWPTCPAERLFPCTNCGMVPLPRDVARGKLAALAAGAALVRRELLGAWLGSIHGVVFSGARVFPNPGRSRMLPKVFCFKYFKHAQARSAARQ